LSDRQNPENNIKNYTRIIIAFKAIQKYLRYSHYIPYSVFRFFENEISHREKQLRFYLFGLGKSAKAAVDTAIASIDSAEKQTASAASKEAGDAAAVFDQEAEIVGESIEHLSSTDTGDDISHKMFFLVFGEKRLLKTIAFIISVIGLAFAIFRFFNDNSIRIEKEKEENRKELELFFSQIANESRFIYEASNQLSNSSNTTKDIINILKKLDEKYNQSEERYQTLREEYSKYKLDQMKGSINDENVTAVEEILSFINWDAPISNIRESFLTKAFINDLIKTKKFPVEYYQNASLFVLCKRQDIIISKLHSINDLMNSHYIQIINKLPSWYNTERNILVSMKEAVASCGESIPDNILQYSTYTTDPYYVDRSLNRDRVTHIRLEMQEDIEKRLLYFPRYMIE
jgi:hypothetical protein